MKRSDHRKLRRRKRRIERRLERRNWPAQSRPMFRSRNLRYEVSERIRATVPGGIGAIHVMACRLGLDRAINRSLSLFKRHLPYFESDHVLNIAYNVLAGGTRLEGVRGSSMPCFIRKPWGVSDSKGSWPVIILKRVTPRE